MQGKEVQIVDPLGIHARPAAQLVQTANRYRSTITLTLPSTGRHANAKSITALLALGVRHGSTVSITAHGDDEVVALAATLAMLIAEHLIGDQDDESADISKEGTVQ